AASWRNAMNEENRTTRIGAHARPGRVGARTFIRRPRLRLVVISPPGSSSEPCSAHGHESADRNERDDETSSSSSAPATRDGGFSLLELLVVVAILGILVAAALPKFAEFRAAAYDSRSQQDLRNLAAAEELYRATSPSYAGDTAALKGFAASEGVEVSL